MSHDDTHDDALSEMSSDDEFFDPEGDGPAELPGPSWLTRALSEKRPTGAPSTRDEAEFDQRLGTAANASPTLPSSGSLDVSQMVATKPEMEADDEDDAGSDDAGSGSRRAGTRLSPPASPSASPGGPATPTTPDVAGVPASPDIPSTAFRLKDLDTGREYIVDEAAADALIGGADAAADAKKQKAAVVRDLRSGKDVPVKELEDNLGLSPLMREVSLRERQSGDAGSAGGAREGGGDGDGSPAPRARPEEEPGKKPFGRNPRRWMTKRLAEASAYASRLALDTSEAASPRGAETDEAESAVSPRRRDPSRDGAEAPPPGTDDAETAASESAARARGRAVRVSVNRKVYKEFTELRCVQTLRAHEDAVWTMKFNHSGRYLATAGQDRVVRVWELDLVSSDDGGAGADAASEKSDGDARNGKPRMSIRGASVFKDSPRREYRGHRGDVLDLCWSRTDWLLSSSMDKTVRLWYAAMDECLRIFSHQDFVTAIDFHPLNDKYFLSGSLDGKLRLWSIPDHHVADWVDIGEMVTAAAFNSDGSTCTAGSYKGKCHFYAMDGVRFEYLTHLEVRHSRGGSKNSGKKITGLAFMPGDDRKLLVTSNDSRVRVYDGYHLACKYKGHKNNNSQIRASFSPGAEFIVCGSEDENVYVWSTVNSFVPSINPIYTGFRRDKHSSYESFRANTSNTSDITTAALFAPKGVRDARRGEAAAAVAKARAAAQSEIQNSRAAAALFRGGPQSPMDAKSAAGEVRNGDEALGDDAFVTGVPRSEIRSGRETRAPNASSAAAASRDENARESPGRPGRGSDGDRDEAAKAKAEGERAFAAAMAIGQIVVTAGYSGEICVFENVGSPQWL